MNLYTYGNAKEVPLLDDPLFYVFDGTFALAYKGVAKLAAKTMGKKSVDQTTEYLLKLDLQMFSKNKFPSGSMSGKDVVKFLKKDGFDVVSQKGSHVKLNGPNGEVVIVPVHGNKGLPVGTLNSIQK